MSYFGKQHRFCPNCGKHHYDERISVDHVKSMCCDAACRDEWELKYARMVLRKDADPNEVHRHSVQHSTESPDGS